MPYYENTNPSNFERKAALLLDQADILYVTEFSFLDLKSAKGVLLRFDFAIFDSIENLEREEPALLLELNGAQHYERRFQTAAAFARQQSNDRRKKNYCAAKGIPLVIIPYTDYNTFTVDQILEEGNFFN